MQTKCLLTVGNLKDKGICPVLAQVKSSPPEEEKEGWDHLTWPDRSSNWGSHTASHPGRAHLVPQPFYFVSNKLSPSESTLPPPLISIFRNGGVRSLWVGNRLTLINICPSSNVELSTMQMLSLTTLAIRNLKKLQRDLRLRAFVGWSCSK